MNSGSPYCESDDPNCAVASGPSSQDGPQEITIMIVNHCTECSKVEGHFDINNSPGWNNPEIWWKLVDPSLCRAGGSSSYHPVESAGTLLKSGAHSASDTALITNSTITPSNSTIDPGNDTNTPSSSTNMPSSSTNTPSSSTNTPSSSADTPSASTNMPDNSTIAPENSTAASNNSTVTPDNSTAASNSTSVAPDSNTVSPSNSTVVAVKGKKGKKCKRRALRYDFDLHQSKRSFGLKNLRK
ncbi:MAG: hypothetical protein Q9220_001414 [cf. Caloplaca sp. 1 TL-2023]